MKDKKNADLFYQHKSFWETASEAEKKAAFKFSEDYKTFLDACKTERETVIWTQKVLEKDGFIELLAKKKASKVFRTFKGKSIAFAIMGKKHISEGLNIVASHIDAPRIDIKPNPLYEDSSTQISLMKTHYYGGIKKYQWVSTPLAIHGIVIRKDGKEIQISIGEDEKDPVFLMPDLLPHLARKEQYTKLLPDAIDAGKMNLIFSSLPDPDKDQKEKVKCFALKLLNEKYGIKEADFLSAELEIVPAGKARDAGMDKSMVMGYGQDDRVCAYTSLKALQEVLKNKSVPEKTLMILFIDKEEIGSEGNTSANSIFMLDFIGDLLKQNGESADSYTLRKCLMKSQILSSDVAAALDPNYPSVHEKQNAALFGYGVAITKYTGSGGKFGANDANAEFTAKLMHLLDDAKVAWQIGELGKVDEGGGGTIAKYLAEYGADVIDIGTGVLGMHSLYELTSKADVYSTYKAYVAFLEKA
ncbi:MAG TPA: aminopeptidase [Candidatus Cloacimonadota bacterium]|nr:aminopeptidase [Candidatus Cloacimonadota bacterium]HPT72064.1 aminopeptidase [Candidatus Cloacimonadota bacterium]